MLKQSHTKTSPPSGRTAPKLIYVAKGLKYEWSHHDDVMRFSTRSFIISKLSHRGCCAKVVEHFLSCEVGKKLLASNPGFPFRILSRSFFSKVARQNPERKAWVRG